MAHFTWLVFHTEVECTDYKGSSIMSILSAGRADLVLDFTEEIDPHP